MLLIDFTIMLIFLFLTTFFMPLENEDGKNNVVITTIRMRKVETYGF